jgi:hypothetical protein
MHGSWAGAADAGYRDCSYSGARDNLDPTYTNATRSQPSLADALTPRSSGASQNAAWWRGLSNHPSFKSRPSELVPQGRLLSLVLRGMMTYIQKRNRRLLDNFSCRGSSRQPRSFCFGKRTQNHGGRGVALRVPCVVCRLRRRANSRSLS